MKLATELQNDWYDLYKQQLIVQMKKKNESSNLILKRFEIIKHIDSTKHKTIKLVEDRNTGQRAILKTYPAKNMTILTQAAFLQFFQGHIGIPNLKWIGSNEQTTILLTDYLGDTLEELFNKCDKKFSLKTVCMLALKIFPIIQNYHEKGILYRNISCRSIQFGRGSKCKNLYFNDLGVSKRYRNKKTFEHIEDLQDLEFNNLNIFSTKSAYNGSELSRKDDMESIILMLIYLLKGGLPWEKCLKSQKPTFLEINQHQQYSNLDLLCAGIPRPFKELLQTCRNYEFTQEPNYYWFIQKIKALMFHKKIENDEVYDWMLKESHYQKFVLSPYVPRIKLDKDKAILEEIYDPVAEEIQLDDLASKYKQFLQKKKKGKSEHKIEKQDLKKSMKSEKDVRNKNKQECCVM